MEDARFEQDRLAMMTAHLTKGAEPFSTKALDQPIGYQPRRDGLSAATPDQEPETEMPQTAIPPAIKAAMNRARIDTGDRHEAMAELRGAEYARLDMLYDIIKPLTAGLPAHIDLFECVIMPSDRPKLYIDMISFVEMARDRRTYRFVQDTRVGRILLCESEKINVVEEAVTNYIGQRLVEREMLLATLQGTPQRHKQQASSQPQSAASALPSLFPKVDDALFQNSLQEAATTAPSVALAKELPDAPKTAKRKSFWQWLGLIYFTAIDILGAVALFGILIALGVGAWHFIAQWLGIAGQ